MRVVLAPTRFAGTLTASEAAEAMARGWRRSAPHDDLVLAPMSDGGPGFVDVLAGALAGDGRAGPRRRPRRRPGRDPDRLRRSRPGQRSGPRAARPTGPRAYLVVRGR